MKALYLAVGVASAIAFGAVPVMADHNSKNGEGWANMPNDIHNTRIETKEADDNEAFRDFVKYGEGADSVNRFATEDASTAGAKAQNGNGAAAMTQAKQMGGTQTQTKQQSGTQTQSRKQDGTGDKAQVKDQIRVKDQKRSRIDMPASSMSRQRSSRSSGGAQRSGGRGNR